jgi:hypothetical protein
VQLNRRCPRYFCVVHRDAFAVTLTVTKNYLDAYVKIDACEAGPTFGDGCRLTQNHSSVFG